MSTVITRSGGLLDLASPDPGSIFRADIAAGLSGACRFAAQTEVFYSVAQHSVMVADLVSHFAADASDRKPGGAVLLAALHHDSHEAFMADLPAPLKQLLPGYDRIAERLDRAIHDAIGLTPSVLDGPTSNLIHRADMVARCVEAEKVVPGGLELVLESVGDVREEDLDLARGLWVEPLDSTDARELFLTREDSLHDRLLEQARTARLTMNGDDLVTYLGVTGVPLAWFNRPASGD